MSEREKLILKCRSLIARMRDYDPHQKHHAKYLRRLEKFIKLLEGPLALAHIEFVTNQIMWPEKIITENYNNKWRTTNAS